MHAASSDQKCTQAQLAEKGHENIMHAHVPRGKIPNRPSPKRLNSPPLAMADPELELG